MSKHSKWAKVKNYKGVADAKRAGAFTKLGRAITVAVKQGGGDPTMNFRLRMAIDKARESNMPKDTIDRAVARGAGGDDGAVIEEAVYEGFGPGGAAIVVHALSDNKNRTLMNVRMIFSKQGGNLGGQNSVAWMFEKKGVFRIPIAGSADELTLKLIDLGAEDVREEDEGLTVIIAPENFEHYKTALEKEGIVPEFAETMLLAKEKLELASPEEREKLENFIQTLEEDEDVDDVVTNAEI